MMYRVPRVNKANIDLANGIAEQVNALHEQIERNFAETKRLDNESNELLERAGQLMGERCKILGS